jgi:GAF domain-containing protein
MSQLPAPVLTALLTLRFDDHVIDKTLSSIVAIAADALDGADEVSITLVRADKPYTAAHSGPLALAADELQYERGYGPCVDAGLSGTVLPVPDMRAETRWPDYADAVLAHGVLSSVSVPLPLQTDLIGALNCYSRRIHALDEAVAAATELAAYVAVAVGNAVTHAEAAQYAEHLEIAMSTRAVIEQAKGVIMAQNRCDAEMAFEILRRASMGRNIKLREVAADIVARVATT